MESGESSTDYCSPGRINIELVNSTYLLYDQADADKVKRVHRIVPEAVGTKLTNPCDVMNPGPPFVLLPEQVMVLVEYESVYKTQVSKDDAQQKQGRLSVQLALKIAKGRKAKALKREGKQCSTSAQLRVRENDLEGIAVTSEEINEVINEATKMEGSSNNPDTFFTPLYATDEDLYEIISTDSIPPNPGFRIKFSVFRDLWRRGYYMTDGMKFGCDYLVYEDTPGEEHATHLVKCVSSLDSLCPSDLAALSRIGTQVKKDVLLAIVPPDSFDPYYIALSWWRG